MGMENGKILIQNDVRSMRACWFTIVNLSPLQLPAHHRQQEAYAHCQSPRTGLSLGGV